MLEVRNYKLWDTSVSIVTEPWAG